jgi:uncharacterized protein DUF5988
MTDHITVGMQRAKGGVTVRIEGAPADLPAEILIARADGLESTVKIQHRDGHEHFQRSEDGDGVIVFRWIGRTKIAE